MLDFPAVALILLLTLCLCHRFGLLLPLFCLLHIYLFICDRLVFDVLVY
jgi:hypothetical protein